MSRKESSYCLLMVGKRQHKPVNRKFGVLPRNQQIDVAYVGAGILTVDEVRVNLRTAGNQTSGGHMTVASETRALKRSPASHGKTRRRTILS